MVDTKTAEPPRSAQVGTIDFTPTWVGIMPALIAAIQDGSEIGRQVAKEELLRLAHIVDSANASRPCHTDTVD